MVGAFGVSSASGSSPTTALWATSSRSCRCSPQRSRSRAPA